MKKTKQTKVRLLLLLLRLLLPLLIPVLARRRVQFPVVSRLDA